MSDRGKEMKIGIVTVFNGNNYGAFLQAFSLEKYLEEKGHEVVFVKNNARNLHMMCLKKIIKKALNGELHGYKFQLRKRDQFLKCVKRFKVCNIKMTSALDLIILGSDEIWNIKRKNISRYPIFFGVGLNNSNIISYAPSINVSHKEDFGKYPDCIASIRKLKNISVRDCYSKKVIESLLGDREICIVTDPTLLHDREFYSNHMKEKETPNSFILVYSYGTHLKKETIAEIVEFSKMKKLKMISILEYFEWCDYNIAPSPFEMLYYFFKADYIVTDTFHGTIFSVIYNKNFVVASKSSVKIIEFLKEIGLQNRVLDRVGKISILLGNGIDYSTVNMNVQTKRENSKQYLVDCFQKIEEKGRV